MDAMQPWLRSVVVAVLLLMGGHPVWEATHALWHADHEVESADVQLHLGVLSASERGAVERPHGHGHPEGMSTLTSQDPRVEGTSTLLRPALPEVPDALPLRFSGALWLGHARASPDPPAPLQPRAPPQG